MKEEKTYYHRHLPHYQPNYATYHIVFRLAGSLPANVVEELKTKKEHSRKRVDKIDEGIKELQSSSNGWSYFEKYEEFINRASTGPKWLNQLEVANVVKDAIHYRDKNEYDLFAYCIMTNHVHMIIELISSDDNNGRDGVSTYMVTKIVGSLKKHTALVANKILKRSGAFWQHESYDHVIRNGEELEKTIWYILNNPVKAGFVSEWNQWQWSYVKAELIL